jgi:hypothetical protein
VSASSGTGEAPGWPLRRASLLRLSTSPLLEQLSSLAAAPTRTLASRPTGPQFLPWGSCSSAPHRSFAPPLPTMRLLQARVPPVARAGPVQDLPHAGGVGHRPAQGHAGVRPGQAHHGELGAPQSWPAPGLRLACAWPAPGLRLACAWPAPGLRLAWASCDVGARSAAGRGPWRPCSCALQPAALPVAC